MKTFELIITNGHVHESGLMKDGDDSLAEVFCRVLEYCYISRKLMIDDSDDFVEVSKLSLSSRIAVGDD